MDNQIGVSSDLSIKALGLAEELGDYSLIARAYMQIASMFAKKHHGLSIYFYRKAERIYEEAKDSHQRDIVSM